MSAPQGAVIVGSAIAFAAVAWQAGTPRDVGATCDVGPTVIKYLSASKPAEVLALSSDLPWPILARAERVGAVDEAPAPAPEPEAVAPREEQEPPQRHARRHRYYSRRRH